MLIVNLLLITSRQVKLDSVTHLAYSKFVLPVDSSQSQYVIFYVGIFESVQAGYSIKDIYYSTQDMITFALFTK